MRPRGRRVRVLTIVWAALLIASPAVSAFADARLARDLSDATSHVEETSSSRCPVVHPPDCGLCRHITHATDVARRVAVVRLAQAGAGVPESAGGAGRSEQRTDRWGRAPPLG